MRHRKKGSRLGRKSNQLKALLRSLVTSLILNDKMVTTQSKAKALVPLFDRLVVKARNNSEQNAIRELKKIIFGEQAQKKFLQEIVPSLEGRNSGFTKAIKIGFRNGDNAPVVRIEILSAAKEEPVVEETPVKEEAA
jgi:large subunit ribosomal protein L17